MIDKLTALLFQPHQRFMYAYEGISGKLILAAYFLVVILGNIVALGYSLVNDNNQEFYGSLGVSYTLVTLLSQIFLFGISLAATILIILLTQLLLKMQGYYPNFREVVKIYLLAYLPGIAFSFIVSLLLGVTVALSLASSSFIIIYNILSCLLFLLSLVLIAWEYFILVNGLKAKYETETGHALISGCLPSVVIIGGMVVLCVCAYFAIFAVFIAAVGTTAP